MGVIPEPGEPLGVKGALSGAVVQPAVVIAEWLSSIVRLLLGEKIPVAGAAKIGKAASHGKAMFTYVFAMLMTVDLVVIAFIYAVVLVVDTRARRRYQIVTAGGEEGTARVQQT